MTFGRAAEDYKSLLTANVIGGCDVTDEGVIDISYSDGIVFDVTNDINVAINASTVDVTLTDDDTNYLYWVAGAGLAVKLTVPTGNEVLVATIVCASGDITTITPAGFDVANLTNISTRPTIILEDDERPHYHTDSLLVITDENLLGFDSKFAVRIEDYKLNIEITAKRQTSSIGIKDLVAEIDSKNKSNNEAGNTNEYTYQLAYTWASYYKIGVVNLIVNCKRRAAL